MKLLQLCLAGSLLLAPLLSRPAAAQTLDPSFSPPTGLYTLGQVYGMGPQQANGKRLISGYFTRANGAAVTTWLLRVDATGAVDQPFQQNAGQVDYVDKIRRFPSGQYLLGGYGGTVTAGGLTRSELLRLNEDGTADASFDVGSGPQAAGSFGYTLDYAVQPDSKVVAVGVFDSFNNAPAMGVVRLNANGSRDPGFTVGLGVAPDPNNFSGGPTTVAVQPDGKILVGGSFDTFNGQPAHALVRLNANGSVDPTFTSPFPTMQQVEALVLQPDGKILVSGYLPGATSGGASLVRLLASGSLDPGFTTSALTNGTVSTSLYDYPMQLQPDGKIVVVGSFSTPNMVARLHANGTLDTSFQPGFPPLNAVGSALLTVGLQPNGAILVGGFLTGSGLDSPFIQLTGTGAPDPSFNARLQLPGLVQALARQPDGKLVLGGNFSEISGQRVHNLARLQANGTLDLAFSAATGAGLAPVLSLALQADGKILTGTGQNIRRFNANGVQDPGFATFTPFLSARALAVQPDGRILVAGGFNYTAGGLPRTGVARLTSTGALDPTFARDMTSTVTGTPGGADALLLQPDGRVVVGGLFRPAFQTNTCRLVRYEADGTLDPTFNDQLTFTFSSAGSSSTGRIHALALQADGQLLASGRFNFVGSTAQNGVVRLSTTGFPDAGFAPMLSASGTVFSLTVQPNQRLLLGGSFFHTAPTRTTAGLTGLLSSGQDDTSFGATLPNGVVRSVLVQPDGALVLAGGFSALGSQPAFGVARLLAPNVLRVAAPAAVAARTAAWPVPAHGVLHVAPDASAQPLSLELLDALGRQVRRQPMSSATEQLLNVENLSAGTYLLRVNYAAGAVTRRIVVE